MKKTLACLLIGILTLTSFTACGGDQSGTSSGNGTTQGSDGAVTTPAATTTTTTTDGGNGQTPDHVHAAGEAWLVDKDNHWHVCECGEVMDSAAHTLEDDVCTVCETEIYEWDDSTVSLYRYNEYGDCVLSIDYDEDGAVTYSCVSEYTYDEDGNMLTEKDYTDGELTYECEFKLDPDGFPYTSKDITYYEDGSKVICEYDADYETISEVWYNADGSIMDNSDKFDAEACKALFGTWETEMDLAEIFFGADDASCTILVTINLNDKGEMAMTMEIDEDEIRGLMYQMTMESIYTTFEEEGLSKAEADAAFEAQMGMTISEYVESMLAETDVNELMGEIPESITGVYYVEDDMLYVGESWNQPLDGGPYTLEGDTLTLLSLETDEEFDMTLVFTKVGD